FPNKKADEVLEGRDAWLSPGFIDVNTDSDHYLSILDHPAQADFLKQGITTIIGGQEGSSLAPLLYGSLESLEDWTGGSKINIDWHTVKEFFRSFERRPLGVNFATLAGHSTIRRAIIGEHVRDMTKNEMAVFARVLTQAMDEGALGLSTDLTSVYGRHTPTPELKALAKIVSSENGVYTTKLREAQDLSLDAALDEALKVAKESGARTILSSLMPHRKQSEIYERTLEKLENLPNEEDVRFDVSPFESVPRPLYHLLPDWAQTGGLTDMAKNLEDEWFRNKLIKELVVPAPEDLVIARAIDNDPLVGLSLKGVMEMFDIKKPADALLKLMRTTKLRALVLHKNVDAKLITRALAHPRSLVASKGASVDARFSAREGALRSEHALNTFPRFFELALSSGIIPIETAIKKVTTDPALLFGLTGRGQLSEGSFADLVGFTIDTAADGTKKVRVRFTVVNGRIAVRDEEYVGALAGRVLRRGQ
ncbi:MAG TPA: amidohydrolase family protein, partial [Candidatus Paceibacterota bacterium]|nr:amidohydrolase family protein [Candidatus Paceibacterota bacterium]